MHTYLIVGKQFSGLKETILASGDDYIVLQDRSVAKHPDKRLKRRILADFSSKEALLATVATIKQPIDGVVNVYENYVLPSAWISEALGLPGMPVAAAQACTDKEEMRQRFASAPEQISPDFCVVSSWEDVTEFADAHQFPLILKPANLAKSLLVTRSDTPEELQSNYHKTVADLDRIYARYAPHRQPKLILEECLIGSIHSVDAFVDDTGTPHVLDQVVDYETGYDIGYDDNFHYSRLLPSALTDQQQQAVRHTAALGCQALEMRSSPAHIEIILTADGPRIVEIGARNGGYRERMHRLANQLDITDNTLRLSRGLPPQITTSVNEPCAVLELFPKRAGIFQGIAHEDALRQLPSLVYFAHKQPIGQHVGKAGDGYKMCAIVILHHADQEQFDQDLAYVRKHVSVTTSSS